MIAILLAVLLMVPLITRATRPRGRSGLRWQGIDWERVKSDEASSEAEKSDDDAPSS
ncbi:MAG: hypothetical protein ABIP89_25525 [Polyangiaceae bacterium]